MKKHVVCECGYKSNPHTKIITLSFLCNAHDDECDKEPEIKPVDPRVPV